MADASAGFWIHFMEAVILIQRDKEIRMEGLGNAVWLARYSCETEGPSAPPEKRLLPG
jgi:hypothetical protein